MLFMKERLVLVRSTNEERCLNRVWVLSHKRRNAEPVSFRALPISYNRIW